MLNVCRLTVIAGRKSTGLYCTGALGKPSDISGIGTLN